MIARLQSIAGRSAEPGRADSVGSGARMKPLLRPADEACQPITPEGYCPQKQNVQEMKRES
ncbi:hypothetical protein CLG96_01540 [Sphingomonas oleivorans]|uniref:Uncharacterized protein n=1 Tax=Sphingomonas oleivorans TaxID=1735121 RepID=A0A2T5G132_9SPHN|nr:hypothetical protein CLG96_01540 [Sphingomonas oleivorans]